MSNDVVIPAFRDDGYLPEGLHRATEAEVVFALGSGSARRRRLSLRLRHWLELSRQLGVLRFLLDGSFVTAKPDPQDIDAVVLLPDGFASLVAEEFEPALELEEMLLTRRPEELFGAEDEQDWSDWVNFFSRTRHRDGRRKGLIEVQL